MSLEGRVLTLANADGTDSEFRSLPAGLAYTDKVFYAVIDPFLNYDVVASLGSDGYLPFSNVVVNTFGVDMDIELGNTRFVPLLDGTYEINIGINVSTQTDSMYTAHIEIENLTRTAGIIGFDGTKGNLTHSAHHVRELGEGDRIRVYLESVSLNTTMPILNSGGACFISIVKIN